MGAGMIHSQRGFSIIEVMVSLVIGLVVVGAVMVSYVSSGQSSRIQSAYTQMAEEAQIGLTTIGNDIKLAGYSRALVFGTSTFSRAWTGRAVYGCDGGFSNPAASPTVACASTGTSAALEVAYEGDTSNTVPTPGNLPSDCLGNTLTAVVTSTTVTYYLATNRYYVSSTSGRSELFCASTNSSGTAIADNVEQLKIWVGEGGSTDPRQVVRYVTPGVSAANVTDWNKVLAVRICMVMRSAEPVLEVGESFQYLNCDQTATSTTDRYVRRAFFSTVTLRNKMGL